MCASSDSIWQGGLIFNPLSSLPLAVALVPPFQQGHGGPGGWQLLVEVEVRFGGDSPVA